jgi:predicted MFS family arabinose efflux permease
MNTVQQPASEVMMTLIVPKDRYQKTSGLQNLSRSLNSVLNPVIATALYSLAGLDMVIAVDLTSFVVAFLALAGFIRVAEVKKESKEKTLTLAKEGLAFLKSKPMILTLILFMSGVNLVASAFNATLPAYVIPNPKGGSAMLGVITSASGLAMIVGSLLVSFLPKPRDRVKMIYITMLISLGSENFILAFAREPYLWVLAQVIGWILVPVMSTNLEVILRNTVPVDLQGRVYACRNTFQFFTIPIGLFLGGFLVDHVCEPFMKRQGYREILTILFGSGKGSGAALMMFILGIVGSSMCLVTGRKLKKYHYCEK